MKRIEHITNGNERRLAENLRLNRCKVYSPSWPDLLVVKPDGKIIFIEVKAEGDSISVKQTETIRLLKKLGFNIEVLKPDGTPFAVINKTNNIDRRIQRIKQKKHIKYPTKNKNGVPFRVAELMRDYRHDTTQGKS